VRLDPQYAQMREYFADAAGLGAAAARLTGGVLVDCLFLGLNLSPVTLKLPGAEFKRAQMLEYDGVPIAQIVYLDAKHVQPARCVTLHYPK
jgi:hypothetical protein